MKHTYITRLVVTAIIIAQFTGVSAIGRRNLYNRLELGGGNVWTFVGLEFLSYGINALTGKPTSEATLRFACPASEEGNLSSFQGFDDWNYDKFHGSDYEYGNSGFAGFKGDNLLSNIIVGEKVGYLSDNMGSVNYCIYGAAYYNLQKYALLAYPNNKDDYTSLTTQRAQLGGGIMFTFGSIENSNRIIIDGGIRYNIPIGFGSSGYRTYDYSTSEAMNKGISSHYMFKYSYDNSIAVGFTLDIMHYNMFKTTALCGNSSKTTEFGISLAIFVK